MTTPEQSETEDTRRWTYESVVVPRRPAWIVTALTAGIAAVAAATGSGAVGVVSSVACTIAAVVIAVVYGPSMFEWLRDGSSALGLAEQSEVAVAVAAVVAEAATVPLLSDTGMPWTWVAALAVLAVSLYVTAHATARRAADIATVGYRR